MCLGVPARILKIQDTVAMVSIRGSIIKVGLQLVDDAKIGDYVLVHTGFALEIIDKEEALETLKTLQSIMEEDPEDMLSHVEI